MIKEHIKNLKRRINDSIKMHLRQCACCKEYQFFQAGSYSILPEGHRYRGLLGLTVYECLGGRAEKFLKSAAGLEFIHHSSLIFDDLPAMDNSPIRKGKQTVHIRYNQAEAILSALFLLEIGLQMIYENASEHDLSHDELDNFVNIRHKALIGMLKGQELDLKMGRSFDELEMLLFEKNRLFHLACILPVLLLRREECIGELDEFGKHIAVAYQIHDDLRDIEDSAVIGKPANADQKKLTTVYIWGRKETVKRLRQEIQTAIDAIKMLRNNSMLKNAVKYIFINP